LLSVSSVHVATHTKLQKLSFSFFNQRIVNVWNSLPHTVDFTSITSFKRTIDDVDYSDFLKVFLF